MIAVFLTLKTVHIIAVIAWMAGLLYLPRLFIYHSVAQAGGELEAKMEEAEANPPILLSYHFGNLKHQDGQLIPQSIAEATSKTLRDTLVESQLRSLAMRHPAHTTL